MIIVGYRGVAGDLAAELARLERLCADLKAVALGRGPSPEQLAAAPFIDKWVEATRPEPCLAGQVQGHPVCRGPVTVTSGLVVWAPELGWVRTHSRYYRLGRPFEAGQVS